MCFEPDSKIKKPKRSWGYKAFREGEGGELLGEYASRGKERERNTWLDEEGFRPSPFELTRLVTSPADGWRIFLYKKDAKEWVDLSWGKEETIVKVRFKNILSVGLCVFEGDEEENEAPTVLAKEIFIPK